MGFWGAIGAGISSVAGGVCSAISSIGSSIGGIIGGGLGSLSRIISTTIPNLNIEKIITVIDTVSKIVEAIGNALGLSKHDSAEELGAKAMECDKKPDDFDSVEEYIKYIENEMKLDKEKFDAMSKEEKIVCSAVGSTILAAGISEKKKTEVDMGFFVEVAKQGMTPEQVEKLIDKFKSKGVELELTKYLKGDMSFSENKEFTPVLKESLKDMYPSLNDNEIEDKIDDMIKVSIGK